MPTPPTPPTPDDELPDRVERRRDVRATPDTVWEVLADPAHRRAWLGGDLDVDLVEGARGTWTTDDEDRPVHVRRVEGQRRLVFDWGEGPRTSTVDIRLDPTRTGTAVRVVETRPASVSAPRAAARATLCLAA